MSKSQPPPPPPPTLSPYQQEQAATLIRSVRERLLAEDPDIADDPDLWRDTLDGESDAVDLIRNLVRARIQAGQPHLGDLDAETLPSDYVEVEVTVTRRPLKDRLLADLRAGQTIPGASLLPGMPFLVITRK